MATVKAPLMSLDASGSIGKAIVFSKWKGRSYVRRHVIPANPRSGLQVGLRSVLRFTSQDYANLSAADLAEWKEKAESDNITRLNAQVRDAQTRARRNLGWRENLTDADPGAIDATTGGAAAAQPKTLVVSWSDPAANLPDYCYSIFMSESTGFTPDISNLVGVVKFGVNTLTVPGLTTGQTYYFRTRGQSTSGFLGTLDSEFSGTPL